MDIHRMRQGQHKHQHNNRQRGRNRGGRPGGGNGGGNPINRVYESNGPDVKVRGTAQTIAEKYLQLARDAQSGGDIVMAESYYQHAEHYLRILAAAQAYNQQQQQQQGGFRRDDGFDEDTDAGLEETEAQGADGPAGSEDQPVVADSAGEQPQPQSERHQHQPRRQRNFDERGDRPPRGERPQRQFQQPLPQADAPRGSEEQPRLSEEPGDGWTGPQPSFLRRPAAAGDAAPQPAAGQAVRARRPFRERPVREAAPESPGEPAGAPSEE